MRCRHVCGWSASRSDADRAAEVYARTVLSRMLPARRPSFTAGVAFALAIVALETLVLFPLEDVAEPVSLGVIYLLGVLLVSIVWGLVAGDRDERRQRAGVQLLPHPAHRPAHDRGRRELGRAGRVPRGRGRRLEPGGGDAAPGTGGGAAPAVRPGSRPSWRGAARRIGALPRRSGRPPSGSRRRTGWPRAGWCSRTSPATSARRRSRSRGTASGSPRCSCRATPRRPCGAVRPALEALLAAGARARRADA